MERAKTKAILDGLVQEGERVLATRRPLPRGSFGADWLVDEATCGAWGSRATAIIGSVFGKDHSFYERAVRFTQHAHVFDHATQLQSVLRAALAVVDDGFLDVEQEGKR